MLEIIALGFYARWLSRLLDEKGQSRWWAGLAVGLWVSLEVAGFLIGFALASVQVAYGVGVVAGLFGGAIGTGLVKLLPTHAPQPSWDDPALTEASETETVERLRIRRGMRLHDATYREAGSQTLELELPPSAVTLESARPLVVMLIGILSTLLLTFAVVVRVWPAVGTVSVAVGALAFLVFKRAKPAPPQRVCLAPEELMASGLERHRAPIADVRGVGAGAGSASSRTLWVELEGVGRVLLLDGLSTGEASAARDALERAVDQARTRARPLAALA